MQHSPFEVKKKLLKALDKDNNVVDMVGVIEVISILEKTPITKDELEQTRLGKYVNELRKKTSDEQLAKRAKALIKSWLKLLNQSANVSSNDERIACTPPVSIASGPGPGSGPGGGPSLLNSCTNLSVVSSCLKQNSPALNSERVASPLCSSGSNSPVMPIRPRSTQTAHSNYAPLTKTVGVVSRGQILSPKTVSRNGSVASPSFSQVFKPVSPALLAVRNATTCRAGLTNKSSVSVACPRPHSPVYGEKCAQVSSHSSKSLPASIYSGTRSKPTTPPSVLVSTSHWDLDIARTNAANKRLRKDDSNIPSKKSIMLDSASCSNDKTALVNGLDSTSEPAQTFFHSRQSPFENFKSCRDASGSPSLFEKPKIERMPKRKGKQNESRDILKEKISAAASSCSSKLSKVKTHQQLMEEFQAKKGATLPSKLVTTSVSGSLCDVGSPSNFPGKPGNYALLGCDAETWQTKSELMVRFLKSSISPEEEVGVNNSPLYHKSSLESPVNEYSNVTRTPPCHEPFTNTCDPVDLEIKNIMSSLPVLEPNNINWDEDYVVKESEPVTDERVDRLLSDRWDCVNGNYDYNDKWKDWKDVTTSRSYNDDLLNILPYVNISW